MSAHVYSNAKIFTADARRWAEAIVVSGDRTAHVGDDLFDERPSARLWYRGGFSPAGLTSVVLGGIATALFLSTDVWTGPLAVAIGYLDLSVPVGMLVSIVAYWALAGRTVKSQIGE